MANCSDDQESQDFNFIVKDGAASEISVSPTSRAPARSIVSTEVSPRRRKLPDIIPRHVPLPTTIDEDTYQAEEEEYKKAEHQQVTIPPDAQVSVTPLKKLSKDAGAGSNWFDCLCNYRRYLNLILLLLLFAILGAIGYAVFKFAVNKDKNSSVSAVSSTGYFYITASASSSSSDVQSSIQSIVSESNLVVSELSSSDMLSLSMSRAVKGFNVTTASGGSTAYSQLVELGLNGDLRLSNAGVLSIVDNTGSSTTVVCPSGFKGSSCNQCIDSYILDPTTGLCIPSTSSTPSPTAPLPLPTPSPTTLSTSSPVASPTISPTTAPVTEQPTPMPTESTAPTDSPTPTLV